jgi:hypothetical protein
MSEREKVQHGEPVAWWNQWGEYRELWTDKKRADAQIDNWRLVENNQLLRPPKAISQRPLYLAPPEPAHKFEPWMVEWLRGGRWSSAPEWIWAINVTKSKVNELIAAAIEDILKGGTEPSREREALRAMDRVEDEHPLVGEFAEDARYNWPDRWAKLRAILAGEVDDG